ncbi:MAG: hypothetical protein ACTSRA_12195, partial [Promethearchaeota archaeon]
MDLRTGFIHPKIRVALLVTVFISTMVISFNVSMLGINPSNNTRRINDLQYNDNNNLLSSYSNLERVSTPVNGSFLNYSYSFEPIGSENWSKVKASIFYECVNVNETIINITESVSGLNFSYGYSNTNRTLGWYNSSRNITEIEDDMVRAYSISGPFNNTCQNTTDFNVTTYSFVNSLLVDRNNRSVINMIGNGTIALNLDSMLPVSQKFYRVYYFGHFRTLLSYYRTLDMILLDPDELYEADILSSSFTKDPNELILNTNFGPRPAISYVRDLGNGRLEKLIFDKHSGVLLKAEMYIDKNPDTNEHIHVMTFELVNSSLSFSVPVAEFGNEFIDAMSEVSNYLSTAAINDTNSSLFFHSTFGDGKTLLNDSKLSSDTFKVLFGYSYAFNEDLHVLFLELNNSVLHDKDNGSFYHALNSSGQLDDLKTITDAAWAILGSIHLGSSITNFYEEILDFMDTLYTNISKSGEYYYGFKHSNETTDDQWLAYDNLIALLALQSLAYSSEINDTIQDRVKPMIWNVSKLFYQTSPGSINDFWDSNFGLYYESIDVKNDLTINNRKTTRDAAIAIITLCELYLHNQTSQNFVLIDRALNVLDQLIKRAWNSTHLGFMHELNPDLSVFNPNLGLEDNSWMLMACIELLQAVNKKNNTKDISYYELALDTWKCIKTHLYDDINKTYRISSSDSSTKSGELGILLRGLKEMAWISNSTELEVLPDEIVDYQYDNPSSAKIEATFWLHVKREITEAATGTNIDIKIPINYSDISILCRYGNGSIYNSSFNVTDPNGHIIYNFPIPTPPVFKIENKTDTIHRITVAANRTGFVSRTGTHKFYITSSVKPIPYIDPETGQMNELMPFKFNITDTYSFQVDENNSIDIPALFPNESFIIELNFSN